METSSSAVLRPRQRRKLLHRITWLRDAELWTRIVELRRLGLLHRAIRRDRRGIAFVSVVSMQGLRRRLRDACCG